MYTKGNMCCIIRVDLALPRKKHLTLLWYNCIHLRSNIAPLVQNKLTNHNLYNPYSSIYTRGDMCCILGANLALPREKHLTPYWYCYFVTAV